MDITESLFNKQFNEFIPSNAHNGIADVYTVAQYTSGTQTKYFRPDAECEINDKIHPEVAVINHLIELLNQRQDCTNIKIYTSDVPCHECCQKFMQFLQTAKLDHNQDLEIEIVFSGIHCIKRPSCIQKNDCSLHLSQVSDNQHQDNVEGLKKLYNTRGVRLRPFTDQDWLDLQMALWRPKIKDEKLNRDFEEIMGFPSTSDQIKPSSQLSTDMSTQTSQADESQEKAPKRKREDAGSNKEQLEKKKVKKQKEEKPKRGLKGIKSKRRGTTSGRGRNIAKKGVQLPRSRSNTSKNKGNTSRRGVNILKRGGNTSRTRGTTSRRGGVASRTRGTTSRRGGNASRTRGTTSRRGGNASRTRGTTSRRGGNASRTRGTTSRRGGNASRTRGTTSGRGGNASGRGGNILRNGNKSRTRGNISGRGGFISKRGGNTPGRRGNVSGIRGHVSRGRTTTGRKGPTS